MMTMGFDGILGQTFTMPSMAFGRGNHSLLNPTAHSGFQARRAYLVTQNLEELSLPELNTLETAKLNPILD